MGKLSYTLSGDVRRPTILFLHGFMGSSEDWWSVVGALDKRFTCLAVDLPGHGASLGLAPEDCTVEGATRSLLTLLDELDIDRTVLVGYSMGGRLALYLALRHPEQCAGLFLESSSPGIEGEAEREARHRADEEKAVRLESGDLAGYLYEWYRQPLFASLSRYEGLVEAVIEARSRNDPAELARSLRGMGAGAQPSLWGEVTGVRIPALVVAGELDERYAGIAARMASLNPRIRSAIVTGVGHNVRVEAPGAYLALLESFLDSL
ncbi:MAG: 2-succinyl-6-hydroxy-2,4-cyclohexadiene-1-carboxylate synthase [Rubrobacteraceae bacterium]